MSLNSILADQMRARAVWLARYDETTKAAALKLLRQLERDLLAKMADLEAFGELTAAQKAQLESTILWARHTISAAYQKANDVVAEKLRNLAAVEVKAVESAFNKGIGVQLLDSAVTPAGLAAIVSNAIVRGNPMEDWWAGQSADLARRFAAQIRMGMVAGDTLGQLVQRVRGTSANGFSDGVMAASTRDASALIRTAVQSVSNDARMKVYKDNADLIGSLQHISTLDDRTTPVCIARDGLEWTIDGTPLGHDLPFAQPPLHWNCRSTLIPITKSWNQLMGKVGNDLTDGQRASLDGAVPKAMTYEQWLLTKSDAFQNHLLGVEKATLWREGSITFRDLIDQSGRVLTVEQLTDLATARDLAGASDINNMEMKAITPPDDFTKKKSVIEYTGPDSEEAMRHHERIPNFIDETSDDSLNNYVLADYENINDAFKKGDPTDPQYDEARNIMSLFNPIHEQMNVYRGMPHGANPAIGAEVTLKAFTSTSTSASNAFTFAGVPGTEEYGEVWQFKLSPKTETITTNSREAEVILKPGTKWVVSDVLRQQKVLIDGEQRYVRRLVVATPAP